MPYDLFICYSRPTTRGPHRSTGRTHWPDFAAFAGRPLRPFLDAPRSTAWRTGDTNPAGPAGLSRLLLACLSPAYLESEFCEWEFIEYLKDEVARFGEGVPDLLVEVPGSGRQGLRPPLRRLGRRPTPPPALRPPSVVPRR